MFCWNDTASSTLPQDNSGKARSLGFHNLLYIATCIVMSGGRRASAALGIHGSPWTCQISPTDIGARLIVGPCTSSSRSARLWPLHFQQRRLATVRREPLSPELLSSDFPPLIPPRYRSVNPSSFSAKLQSAF